MLEIMIGLVGGKMEETKELITTDDIRSKVYIIRGQQVMLDKDLAEIYGYDVKRLNEQVKRNINRFPEDFMFQLKASEITDSLKSQIATLNLSENKRGMHIKKMSDEATCVFIEHAHSVVDITRMPGWVSDHCVVPSHTKGETNEKKTVGALQTPTVFCHAKAKIKQLQSLMHLADHSISKLRSFGRINVIRKFRINGGSSRAIVQAKGICLNVIRCLVVSILCNAV